MNRSRKTHSFHFNNVNGVPEDLESKAFAPHPLLHSLPPQIQSWSEAVVDRSAGLCPAKSSRISHFSPPWVHWWTQPPSFICLNNCLSFLTGSPCFYSGGNIVISGSLFETWARSFKHLPWASNLICNETWSPCCVVLPVASHLVLTLHLPRPSPQTQYVHYCRGLCSTPRHSSVCSPSPTQISVKSPGSDHAIVLHLPGKSDRL